MKVFLSPLAEYKLTKLLLYLEEEWGKPSKEKFLQKLEQKSSQISSHPRSNPQTEEFDDIYWCVVTTQSSFYYRILNKEIEIITITDNRQNPDKIIKEIRSYFKT
ncbi:type II toxin-antitoxin system RelE/ParE family toxin [Rhodohalobacter sulfatireducens]|uniref:Type II toxin-antitoxin system RelE/ParE family toxin n=1 Tax=Rhodohalobacter sulfatireducens TaxID=2911366 RepID=A0ABS9KEC9_9BACT|nr:type II toxin-antitoxin system RelE/ParE family toxin [Rhodohalobacter sulfatireducens]